MSRIRMHRQELWPGVPSCNGARNPTLVVLNSVEPLGCVINESLTEQVIEQGVVYEWV